MTAQFKLMPADPALVSSIQQELGLPHFAARTMVAHGVNSLEEARAFLAPDIERDWLNPYTIPQLGAAVDRLERAVRDDERHCGVRRFRPRWHLCHYGAHAWPTISRSQCRAPHSEAF